MCRFSKGGTLDSQNLSPLTCSLACGLQVPADRFAADTRGLLDAGERPAQAAQRTDLLLSIVVQDVAHSGHGTCVPRPRQRLCAASTIFADQRQLFLPA